jgi:hypothetical protein
LTNHDHLITLQKNKGGNMPQLDTTIDRSAETLERLMAAIVAAGTMKIDPAAAKAILFVFCANQEPAEA